MAYRFLLLPVSQGNYMPAFGFKQAAKYCIDGIKSVISNANCKTGGCHFRGRNFAFGSVRRGATDSVSRTRSPWASASSTSSDSRRNS